MAKKPLKKQVQKRVDVNHLRQVHEQTVVQTRKSDISPKQSGKPNMLYPPELTGNEKGVTLEKNEVTPTKYREYIQTFFTKDYNKISINYQKEDRKYVLFITQRTIRLNKIQGQKFVYKVHYNLDTGILTNEIKHKTKSKHLENFYLTVDKLCKGAVGNKTEFKVEKI